MTNSQEFSVVEIMGRAAVIALLVMGFVQSVAALI